MSPLSDSVDLTAKVDPQDLVGGICSVNCWQLELVAEVDGSLETWAQDVPPKTPTAWLELILMKIEENEEQKKIEDKDGYTETTNKIKYIMKYLSLLFPIKIRCIK